MKTTRMYFALFLLLALLLTACGGLPVSAQTETGTPAAAETAAPQVVVAEGRLVPARSARLGFAQGGVVAEVLASPGERVTAGQPLARLVGSESAEAELAAAVLEQTLAAQARDALLRGSLNGAAQAEKTLLDAQQAYETETRAWKLPNRSEASDLDLALDDYKQAELAAREARGELVGLLGGEERSRARQDARRNLAREEAVLAEDYAALLAAVAAYEHPLSAQQTRLLNAIAGLEAARDARDRLNEQNLDPEALAAAEARLNAAIAHAAAAEAALKTFELRAPFAGRLLRLDLVVGETALPGAPAAFVADDSAWQVETKDLAEIDIARVTLNQPAAVLLDAYPGEMFRGQVRVIDPVGREYLGDMTYQVTVALDESDPRFLWNMTATVEIEP